MDSPYFDSTYFDPLYFDTDAAAAPTPGSGGGSGPIRRRRPVSQQQPETVKDNEDWLVLIT